MSEAMDCQPAPVAVFAFNRPEHLARALESLDRNPCFRDAPLHVFLDGARNAGDLDAVLRTRAVAREWDHPRKSLHEAPANRGVARSVADGVTLLCGRFGRVIVVEDDLVVAPAFLEFMNRALLVYADHDRVMQIAGHMFPVGPWAGGPAAAFLPFVTSWGWATWARAWIRFDPSLRDADSIVGNWRARRRFDLDGAFPYYDMLRKQTRREIDSWAICWYLSVFRHGGLVLYPSHSLVRNDGFDGSGTHCERSGEDPWAAPVWGCSWSGEMPEVLVNEEAFAAVKAYLRSRRTVARRLSRFLRRRVIGEVSV